MERDRDMERERRMETWRQRERMERDRDMERERERVGQKKEEEQRRTERIRRIITRIRRDRFARSCALLSSPRAAAVRRAPFAASTLRRRSRGCTFGTLPGMAS